MQEFQGTDRYQIQRRLGAGGMGVVYEALDTQRGSPVALKLLRRVDAAGVYRFKKEFRALTDVTHPNLVTLYELHGEGAQWFFTMELVHGQDFLAHVRQGTGSRSLDTVEVPPSLDESTQSELPPVSTFSPMDVTEIVDLNQLRNCLSQLSAAIHSLHEQGKLHRDIKPSNVLVDKNGHVTVVDFGLVREEGVEIANQTMDNRVMGTPAYMSPEQAAGQATSPASDWYAVGVMLYEALTGHLPFGGGPSQLLIAKQQRDPAPPARLARNIPEDLAILAMQMLRRNPEDRPVGQDILRGLSLGEDATTIPPEPKRNWGGLIGRNREMAALEEQLQQSRRQTPQITFITGTSGYGKSTLARHFLLHARKEHNAVVLAGRCYEQESIRYKAFDSLMDALTRYLRRLQEAEVAALLPRDVHAITQIFPQILRCKPVQHAPNVVRHVTNPRQLQRRAFDALRELLARIADRKPLVLFVDDLQWSDADSALLIRELLTPQNAPSLMFIGALRSEDADENGVIETLKKMDAQLIIQPLNKLDHSQSFELAQALLRRQQIQDPSWSTAIAEEADGNPWFIEELARCAEEQNNNERTAKLRTPRSPTPQSSSSDAHTTTSPLDLRQALHSRVAYLDPPVLRLLQVIALAARPLPTKVAFRAANLGEDAHKALVELRARHLLRTRKQKHREQLDTALEAYHDRIRSVVTENLTTDEAIALHKKIAEAMLKSNVEDPESIAFHWSHAGQSQLAHPHLLRAAEQAMHTLAFEKAAYLFESAVTTAVSDQERNEILAQSADAWAHAGKSELAAKAYLQASDNQQNLELVRKAAEHFMRCGHLTKGRSLLESVLSELKVPFPKTPKAAWRSTVYHNAVLTFTSKKRRTPKRSQEEQSRLLAKVDACWSAAVGLGINDTVRSSSFEALHLRLALRAGEPYRITRALGLHIPHVAGAFGTKRAQRLVPLATQLAEEIRHPHATALVKSARAMCAYLDGHWTDTIDQAEEALDILRNQCTNVAWEIATVEAFRLTSLHLNGDLKQLEQTVPKLAEEARRINDLYACGCATTGFAASAWLVRNDPDQAKAYLTLLEESSSKNDLEKRSYPLLIALGMVDHYQGNHQKAADRFESWWDNIVHSHIMRIRLNRNLITAQRALTALHLGPEKAPLQWVYSSLSRLHRDGSPVALAFSHVIEATLARTLGDPQKAMKSYQRAAAGFDALNMRHYAEATRYRYGALLNNQQGADLCDEMAAHLIERHVQKPEQFVQMILP